MSAAAALKWQSVVGYGLGDAANNFAFSLGLLFLLNYYTDVAGIDAAAAGTLLMLVRIYDAAMDMVVGRVIDGTRASTRWGRFRPYLLYGSLPLLLLNVAVFSVPATWGTSGKLAYAYITYALLGTAYALVNIPYGALASVMTQAPRERSRLSAARTLLSTATVILLASVLGSALRGEHGAALQAQLTEFTLLLAAVGVLLHWVCVGSCREVVERSIMHPPWKDSLATLRVNRPLQMLCLIALCTLIGASSAGASAMYYARYVLGDAKHFLTITVATTVVGMLLGVPAAPLLVGPNSRPLTEALVLTGMRIGEASALKVHDVILAKGKPYVRISQGAVTLSKLHGGTQVGTPKSGRSRIVPLTPRGVEVLRGTMKGKSGHDLVFTNSQGGRVTARAYREVLVRACRKARLRHVAPHDLRDTYASWAIQAGANIKMLQEALGHASATLTLDTYAKLLPGDMDVLRSRLAEAEEQWSQQGSGPRAKGIAGSSKARRAPRAL